MKTFDEKLEELIVRALEEDLGDGDHSTLSVIPPGKRGKAVLKIKEAGILAGMGVAEKIFRFQEPDVLFTAFKKDGEWVNAGETAFELEASVYTILTCERLVLNCMQRMSGIATLTHQYVEKIRDYPTRLLDTRKTTPNFRLLEKEAVRIGGGVNHRFGLYDMIMLKDNHIDFCGGIAAAIDAADAYNRRLPEPLRIEVETRTMADVQEVMKVGAGKVFRIMLDNFSPALLSEAITLIDHRFETEASGGIHLDTIVSYARTGVDFISVGGLIHQARSIDLSLKAVIL
ncbi:MAG: carboxylating nicotinate-nucleotide diphosphorylase [Bacteroidota bacterium]|nr:carboxylating nicotinate-nucleotide diphosphorylase [Bacteroidota bacterium]